MPYDSQAQKRFGMRFIFEWDKSKMRFKPTIPARFGIHSSQQKDTPNDGADMQSIEDIGAPIPEDPLENMDFTDIADIIE